MRTICGSRTELARGCVLSVNWDEQAKGRTAAEVSEALQNGSPAIFCRSEAGDLHIAVHTLREGETEIVLRRLQEELA